MVYVIKMNGMKARFDRERIIQSCLRSGADMTTAESVVSTVEKKIYDGISTEKLMQMVKEELMIRKKDVAIRYDLKRALGELDPLIHEFEWYMTKVFQYLGHQAKHSPEPKIKGFCVDHEIDIVITTPKGVFLVECKHHFKSRAYTGLDVPMRQWARVEDVEHAFKAGRQNAVSAQEGWVVTNTKFSDHAKQYGSCKGIKLIGWNYPQENGINQLIDRACAYPLTSLHAITHEQRLRLMQHNIYTTRCLFAASDLVLKASGLTDKQIREVRNDIVSLSNCILRVVS